MGFSYKKPITAIKLTDEQVKARLEWCIKYKGYDWEN